MSEIVLLQFHVEIMHEPICIHAKERHRWLLDLALLLFCNYLKKHHYLSYFGNNKTLVCQLLVSWGRAGRVPNRKLLATDLPISLPLQEGLA